MDVGRVTPVSLNPNPNPHTKPYITTHTQQLEDALESAKTEMEALAAAKIQEAQGQAARAEGRAAAAEAAAEEARGAAGAAQVCVREMEGG